MKGRARKPRPSKAEKTALLKTPRWGAQAPAHIDFPGYGKRIDADQREAELTRFVGYMVARGWNEVHRMPGAVLLAQTHLANGEVAIGMVAAGAAVGGVGVAGALAGIGMIILGVLLTATIIGAVFGIPLVLAGLAVFTGGAATATAGGAVGAGGMALGRGGAASRDQTPRLQAWTDETGRIYTQGA
ncbi:hypothetical protein [Streptomyces sp. MZ04]|uniref:hypothetical protein n=1 Tax=Streptomyces sp. MZ04 TaxID=2559236 RepID=UPI00107EE0C1|nr:hypothetical protein [Streptomyces sp. MZ04]TGB16041.1 hypothetical protein E2651_00905 [Streptomyces sp. MZ04]